MPKVQPSPSTVTSPRFQPLVSAFAIAKERKKIKLEEAFCSLHDEDSWERLQYSSSEYEERVSEQIVRDLNALQQRKNGVDKSVRGFLLFMLDVFGSECFSKGNQAPNILKIGVIKYIEEDSGRNNSNTAKLIQAYLSTRTSRITISDSHSIRTRIIDWRKRAIEGEYESAKKDCD